MHRALTRPLTRLAPRYRAVPATLSPPAGRGNTARASRRMRPRRSDAAALYRLMAWLSPAYPVGAFSYSSGIEWAVEAGDIKDAASLRRWLAVVIAQGGGFCDAVLLRPRPSRGHGGQR